MVVSEAGNLTFGSLQAGSTRWMAPEFTASAEDIEEPNSPLKPTKAVDIYSFGCIMLQVCWIMTIPDSLVFSSSAKTLSGKVPCPWITPQVQVICAITLGRKPFREVEINVDETYRLLSSRCLSRTPEGCPSIFQITTIVGSVKSLTTSFHNIPTTVQAQLTPVDDDTWGYQRCAIIILHTGQINSFVCTSAPRQRHMAIPLANLIDEWSPVMWCGHREDGIP
jgi:serine/threonine protein kinase